MMSGCLSKAAKHNQSKGYKKRQPQMDADVFSFLLFQAVQ